MEETVEFRKIVEVAIKGKGIIVSAIVICIVLAGVLSWFVLPEKYESKAVIQVLSRVDESGSIVSNYIAAEYTPKVFTERLKNVTVLNAAFESEQTNNKFNGKNLTVANAENSNLVNLTYKSDSPEDAQKELQTILSSTKHEMNNSIQNSLNTIETTYEGQASLLTEEIETLINEYNLLIRQNKLPEVLILQTVLDSDIILDISDKQTSTLTNVSGDLQNQLLQLQAQIKAKSEEYRKILGNYQSVKTEIENFKSDQLIRVIAEPTLASGPSSPDKLINLGIGLVVGLMIGFSIVYFRYYWEISGNTK